MPGIEPIRHRWAAFMEWVCPPSPSAARMAPAEVQRRRISRFLPVILLIGLIENLTNLPLLSLNDGALRLLFSLLTPLLVAGVCLCLCHQRRAPLAAWCYIGSFLLVLFLYIWAHFTLANYLDTLSSVRVFIPICAVGILISPRACWIASAILCGGATIFGLVAFERTPGFLSDLFTTDGLLLAGTAVVALGSQGLHRALREADRTSELSALNQQLAAYNAEIAHREQDARAQRRFLDAVLGGVAPDAFFVLDQRGTVLRCNAAFERLFGLAPLTAVGQSLASIPLAPTDYGRELVRLNRLLLQQGQIRTETAFTARDGRRFVLESHVVALPQLGIFVVIGRDISARMAMEARLRLALTESDHDRHLLQTVLDTVQDALVVFDAQGEVILRNAALRALHPEALQAPTAKLSQFVTMFALDGTRLLPDQWPHRRVLRGEAITNPQVLRVKFGDHPMQLLAINCVPLHDEARATKGVLVDMQVVTQEVRQRRNIEITQAIAHACAEATEETVVAREAMRVLFEGTGAAVGYVVVRDTVRPGFARALTFQHDAQVPGAIETGWYEAIANWPIVADSAITSLRVLATEQIYSGPYVIPAGEGYAEFRLQTLTMPLRREGAVIGALSLHYWPEDAEGIDQELVLLAADEIGVALHRARLYEEAQRLALVDPLTGLSNHRALQSVVRNELATGAAQSLPVSVIMLDLDHFRQFNELYGHDRGDQALRSVAKAIANVLRPGDTAARFSGEEFAVVLPATDADQADDLAVRMSEAIARQILFIDHAGAPVRLTISAGHATFPLHASAPASLLKAADLALYAAKRGGRNCVVAYTVTLIEDNAHLLPMGTADSLATMGEITLPTGADLETVQAFITAIDLRDGYTAAHSDGVSRYAVAIASEMNLPAEYVEALRLGGLVHDVGKIGVSDQVLRKPGKLDAEEWQQMQQHTVMGEAILRPLEQLRQLLPLVRWHHERLDGSGYPDGLRGDEIPLLVRILSVADVFEAFTAERPYHPGRPAIEGLHLLQREAAQGKMDPYVVEVFERILIGQGLVTHGSRGEQDLLLAA